MTTAAAVKCAQKDLDESCCALSPAVTSQRGDAHAQHMQVRDNASGDIC
jgi:hypothetical protein